MREPRVASIRRVERLGGIATTLFAATSIVAALVVAALLVSGWSGGRLDNDIEWLYWAGAILGGVGIALLGIAVLRALWTGERTAGAVRGFITAGVALFLLAPVLCVVAVFTDYWI